MSRDTRHTQPPPRMFGHDPGWFALAALVAFLVVAAVVAFGGAR